MTKFQKKADKVFSKLQVIYNLKVCPLPELADHVAKQNKMALKLLGFENEIGMMEVNFYQSKLNKKFLKIEHKIVGMNEGKYKLSQEELDHLEKVQSDYIALKKKYNVLVDGGDIKLASMKDATPQDFKHQVERLQKIGREMGGLFFDIKETVLASK